MNKIIEQVEKNVISEDILFSCYGIKSEEHFDLVIIAPSWEIEKTIDSSQFNYFKIHVNKDSASFVVDFHSKKVLYVQLKIGAPNMVDFCLSCYKLNCENFIFIGSAGGLDKSINLGDVIIPKTAISANGATLFLHDNVEGNNLFEIVNVDEKLYKIIKNCFDENKISFKEEKVISIDSVFAEYAHIEQFKRMGANVVEMEFATFLKAMGLIGKRAAGFLIVSDNSANGTHLVGRTEEQMKRYHYIRSNIGMLLSNIEL